MKAASADQFEIIARAKLVALLEIYHHLQAEPPESDDRALYQRQTAGKAVLTHIALLRKLLHLTAPASATAHADALDITGYRAMVAALDEAENG